MNVLPVEIPATPPGLTVREACTRTGQWLAGIENIVLSVVLAAMVVLPLAEIVLRFFFSGIEAVSALVQHLTLAVACIGAAIAARENKLLSFSAAQFLDGRIAQAARIVSHGASAGICALLFIASIEFVRVEIAGAGILAYGVPTWVFELVQPLGFALITLRLLRHAANNIEGVALTTLLAAAVVTLVATSPLDPASLVTPALVALLVATLLGAPIFAAVGGAALIALWGEGVPLASLAVDHYSIAVNPSLPAIPMFTLAGYFLAESRSPQRLMALFDALFGQLRGSAAIVTVLAATFFTSFTGASGVTILALGGLTMPLLLRSGYMQAQALGLVTGGGSAGVLLMPALPLVLYAIVAKIEIQAMFLAGILPALLMLALLAIWGIRKQPLRQNVASFDWRNVRICVCNAKWELALPLVPIGALFSGYATPVEAAALTALYTFIVATFIHRDLMLTTDVPRVMTECGLVVGGILLILGVALGLSNYLVDAQMITRLIALVTESIQSPWVFLLALNGFLLVAGCFMDIFAAIVVLVPLIVPLGEAFGINSMHLGLIFLANLELGYLTPPVGMNLFFAATRFKKSVLEVCRSVIPLFLLLCIGVLLITYLPFLSTALPALFL